MDSTHDNGTIVRIPVNRLSPEALESLIEEFVTRDGTDYGETDVPLQRKIDQVKRQIISGKAVILFDGSTQTCTIAMTDDPRLKDRSVET